MLFLHDSVACTHWDRISSSRCDAEADGHNGLCICANSFASLWNHHGASPASEIVTVKCSVNRLGNVRRIATENKLLQRPIGAGNFSVFLARVINKNRIALLLKHIFLAFRWMGGEAGGQPRTHTHCNFVYHLLDYSTLRQRTSKQKKYDCGSEWQITCCILKLFELYLRSTQTM